ncbi:MAG: hydrogenase iron-sulfur subunit [Deltaproteobacteria bacterium]|nr:hydrogenase iron-sulfur subunit [Deltaproteobacteria bacterium]
MDKKLGVYVCKGCGIGDAINVEALSEAIEGLDVTPHLFKDVPVLCSKEGVDTIKADIEGEGINAVVVAACSPRVLYDVFDFPGCLLERVNLREGVTWCQPPGEEDTQMMANDYLRLGITKISKSELPEPFKPEEEISKRIMVVGGGMAGLTAALEGAKAGYEVVLVEKEAELGGWKAKFYKEFSAPYNDIHDLSVTSLIQQVQGHDKIKVYTASEIDKTAGGPGLYSVDIKSNGGSAQEKIGAIVMATGWKPYDPSNLEHLGYGKFKNVVTNIQMEEMAKAGKIVRPSDGGPVKKVGFIQCAGSRDPERLPYCSAVCCLATMKQATYLKQMDADSQAYVVYKDIRTPMQTEDLYRKVQRDGAVFIRGEVESVSEQGGSLVIEAMDVLLNDKVRLEELDLVVLATGMVPTSMPAEIPKKEMPAEGGGTELREVAPDSGFFSTPALRLQYRQGPEIPTLKYGFPDSHFVCFPYETRRTGIYAAGVAHRPMDSTQAKSDAAGAMLKAIQVVEATAVGAAVHPRSGDMTYPDFFMQRCTQCKRCTEECPFGAINEDEKGNPLPNPTRCRRCGVCMGACPERIISFKNYSVGMIGSMIKSIHIPEEDEEKPRAVVLVCENDAYPALDMAGLQKLRYSPFVRVIPMRCLGGLNLVWIADALSRGVDGILLLGCRHGDDYQCHFIKGSELATTRLSKVAETLNRLALESERVKVEEVSIADAHRIPEILNEFMETLEGIGPNPYKGW